MVEGCRGNIYGCQGNNYFVGGCQPPRKPPTKEITHYQQKSILLQSNSMILGTTKSIEFNATCQHPYRPFRLPIKPMRQNTSRMYTNSWYPSQQFQNCILKPARGFINIYTQYISLHERSRTNYPQICFWERENSLYSTQKTCSSLYRTQLENFPITAPAKILFPGQHFRQIGQITVLTQLQKVDFAPPSLSSVGCLSCWVFVELNLLDMC